MDDKISVCIATYNGEAYIKNQIESILIQLRANDEIVISDDNSSDQTLQIIRALNDERIRIVTNFGNSGPTNNFLNALINSTGKYIFLSDQDDVWLNNKVDIVMSYFKNYNYGVVISDCFIVDKNLNIIEDSYFDKRGKSNSFFGILIKPNYLGCCMSFNRDVLIKALPFPTNIKYTPHDLWLGLIGYRFFKVFKTNEKLIYYRRHGDNVSTGGEKSKNKLLFRIKYRLYLLKEIIKKSF